MSEYMSFDELGARLDALEYEMAAQFAAGQRRYEEIERDFNQAASVLINAYSEGVAA